MLGGAERLKRLGPLDGRPSKGLATAAAAGPIGADEKDIGGPPLLALRRREEQLSRRN